MSAAPDDVDPAETQAPDTSAPEVAAQPTAAYRFDTLAAETPPEPIVRPQQVSSSASRGLVGNRRKHPAG